MGPKSKYPIDHPKIIYENPEKFYTFGDEIGQGKFGVVRKVQHKISGDKLAAKIIKYDSDTLRFAVRELNWMTQDGDNGPLNHQGLVAFKEAYLVRKYLIIVMEAAGDKTLLDFIKDRHTLNEDVMAGYIKQLCEVLDYLHKRNCLHLDLRPTNIRIGTDNVLKLVDYNSCKLVSNKKAGEVVDVIGDTEFCAPEMLRFEPTMPGTDMWSVAVLAYIMLSGISPFYYEDEDEVLKCVQQVKWKFDVDGFGGVTSEAKDFISKLLVRAPESRMQAAAALEHTWLSEDYASVRKGSVLDCKDVIAETDERLYSEEEEDYVWGSFILKTFDEEEHVTTDDDEEE